MITTATFVLWMMLTIIQKFVKTNISGVADILILLMIVFIVIGTVDSIRGIKEPNTWKKGVGLILNITYTVLFICLIIASIIDISKAIG